MFRKTGIPPPTDKSNNNNNNNNNNSSTTRKVRYTIKNITLCDRCGEERAEVDCAECQVAFCSECSRDIHQFGKWKEHHLHERIKEVKIEPKDESDKHARLRKAVINEIINSERDYLSYLDIFQKVYISPIKEGRFPELKQAKPLTQGAAVDIIVIFSTVQDLAKGSQNFLQDLEAEVKKDDPAIGKVFLMQLDSLPLYSVFCNHQNDAQTIVQMTEQKSKDFKKFLEGCLEDPQVKGLRIIDFIAKPFQRITKYPLLLKQLIEHTPEKHPDFKPLSDALVQFETEVNTLNKNKAGADNLRKMLEIHSVEGLPKEVKLLEKSFVKEGFLRKISKNKDQERYFYLLKDMLLYCAKSLPPRSVLVFKGVIEMRDLLMEDLPDTNSVKNAWQLTNRVANKTYIVYAPTKEIKASWLREIELAKEDPNQGAGPHPKAKYSKSLSSVNLKKPVKGVGARPIWKPDEAVDNCMKCHGKFTVKNRKHHCRKCGNIFCQICSDFSATLPPQFEYKTPQKVCVDCHNEMNAPTSTTPSTLISQQPTTYKSGYLVKKGHRRKNWNRRYFVLSKGVLYYYESDKTALEKVGKRPAKGAIALQEYTFCPQHAKPNDNNKDKNSQNYRFLFVLKCKSADKSKGKDFSIRAENQTDFDEWSRILTELCSSTQSIDYLSDN